MPVAFLLTGTVTSGFGKGKEFLSLEGYARQFDELLGYEPYPGTLNLDVSRSIRSDLEALDSIAVEGWEDGDRSFGAVDCYPASVPERSERITLHLIVPRRTDHDHSTAELVSPTRLRERLDLSDGDTLEIRVGSPSADGV